MDQELFRYLKLFTNYERRFKSITVMIPLDLYNKYQFIIESKAKDTGFNKIGEIQNIVLFENRR